MKLALLFALSLAILAPAVRAEPDTDRKIENAARASYNYRTVLHDKVDVTALDGVVTLTGRVPDETTKDLAEETVRDLPGVTRVQNNVTVEPPPPEHSDSWLAFKINSLLLLKSNVSSSNTKVEVKDGVVTLTGTAETVAQKELTENYVRDVAGVKNVNNQLAVQSAPPPPPGRKIGEVMDDAAITTQVKYALLKHESTSALNTRVTTRDGVVTIEGEAENAAEKTLVSRLAQRVPGVKSVTNSMTLKK